MYVLFSKSEYSKHGPRFPPKSRFRVRWDKTHTLKNHAQRKLRLIKIRSLYLLCSAHIVIEKYDNKTIMHNISINRFCFSFYDGGTLIFSYIRRLRPFLGAQSFNFQYFSEK